MAIPLIPFVAGAVIGGLATYLYRDEKLRNDMKRTADTLSDKVKDAAGEVSDKMSEGYDELRQKFTGKPDAAPAKRSKKAAAKKAKTKVAKKTTAKKKVSKKKAAAKDTIKQADN